MTKAAPHQFQGDYGIHPLDGYAQDGAAKASFRKEGTALLERLRTLLGAESSFTQGRRQVRAISWNPAGPGSSGDLSASLFAPGEHAGVYVVLGCVSVGSIRASPSGVTLMWRLTTRGNPFGGSLNRWENFDVNLEDLSNRIKHALKARTLPGEERADISCTMTPQPEPVASGELNPAVPNPEHLNPAPLEPRPNLEPAKVEAPSFKPPCSVVSKLVPLEPKLSIPGEFYLNQAHPASSPAEAPPPALPPKPDPYALL